MKNLAVLILLSVMLAACSKRSGMSANVSGDHVGVDTVTSVTLPDPDYDFTDSTPEPDLNVPTPDQIPDEVILEIPEETTTTTTTTLPVASTTTTSSTSTTLAGASTTSTTSTTVLVTTTTTTMPPETGDLDFEPALLVPGAKKEDFVGSANMSPTIFSHLVLNETAETCSAENKVSIWTRADKGEPVELVKICKKNYDICFMEGSCVVVQGQNRYPFNYVGWNKTYQKYIFTLIDVKRCPYGYGPGEKCLDPYYSVAADLSIYKLGDVIFVPAIVGLDMGNGTKHHGFFVVRDTGGLIKGRGRFDFFTGYHNHTHPKNLFKKFRLGDVKTNLKYYLLKNPGKLNTFVKKMRNYPNLPHSQLN